jgi:internalin A
MLNPENIIENALKEDATALYLTKMALRQLPSNFASIAPKLEFLSLENNEFYEIPAQLGLCSNLQTLIISGNRLSRINNLIGLRKLTALYLSKNPLNDFPNECLELPLLETLRLVDTGIAQIPAGIAKLRNLKVLDCSHCNLESLPPEIATMPNLKSLIVSGNPLKTPPVEIAERGIEAVRAYFDDLTQNTTKKKGENRLLAIAIEDYKQPYSKRPNCIIETKALIEVLHQRFDYQKITSLFDQNATHTFIRAALDDLVKYSQPDDSVIIYFNGWTGDARQESDFFGYNQPGMIGMEEMVKYISSMRAKQVLLMVDNYLQSSYLGQMRVMQSQGSGYNARWAMYRTEADYEARFTPKFVDFLKSITFEFDVQILQESLHPANVSPLSISGDEGGTFLFYPKHEDKKEVDIYESIDVDRIKTVEQKIENVLSVLQEDRFNKFIAHIKSQITEARTEDALKSLQEVMKGQNDIILLTSRYNAAKKQNNMGLIKFGEWSRIQNQINFALLEIIGTLKVDDFDKIAMDKKSNNQFEMSIKATSTDNPITDLLNEIETLRKELLTSNSTRYVRYIQAHIDQKTAELQALQQKNAENAPQSPAPKEDETLTYFDNQAFNTALAKNDEAAFLDYIKQFPKGLFVSEAQRYIEELRQQAQEEQYVSNLKNTLSLTGIQTYFSLFPNGKYRAEVEKIQQNLDLAEEKFWQETQKSDTQEAYTRYRNESVLQKYNTAALEKIKQIESTQGQLINEAKIIIVGNGRVGKTSVSKVIMRQKFDPNENSTHGVRILPWKLKSADNQEFTFNIWDFGGQEIYHNTHNFFLTKRALYLMVWNKQLTHDATDLKAERDERSRNFTHEYWLDLVRVRSQNSPVLMLQNVFNGDRSPIDETRYAVGTRYNVRDFCEIDAATCTHDDLKNIHTKILHQCRSAVGLKELIPFRLPTNWLETRQKLEKMGKINSYISVNEYNKICTEAGISDPKQFGLYLCDVGAMLYFPEAYFPLCEIIILNPVWATVIIYRILNEKVQSNQGQFSKSDLTETWDQKIEPKFDKAFRFENAKEVQIFIDLMLSFNICFESPEGSGNYIAPQFLPLQKPDIQWNKQNAKRFGFQYEFLPQQIIARLIARLSAMAKSGEWWKNGIKITRKNTEAWIESDGKNLIQVEILGENPDAMIDFLDDHFTKLNDKLPTKSVVFCPKCDAILDKEKVLRHEKKGNSKYNCDICEADIRISDIFKNGKKDMAKIPKFFISYSHNDEKYKDEFQKWLGVLNWKDKIEIWEDRQILAGSDWDQSIKDNFESSDIIVLLVSIDFLASKYIKEVEFDRAMQRHETGDALILPILIRQCPFDLTPLKRLQMVTKNARPISDYDSRDDAWNEVIGKIKEQLEKKFEWGK